LIIALALLRTNGNLTRASAIVEAVDALVAVVDPGYATHVEGLEWTVTGGRVLV